MKQSELKGRNLLPVLIFFFLLGITSCSYSSEKSSRHVTLQEMGKKQLPVKGVDDTTYPPMIIEKGLQKKYDEAKWNLYVFSVLDTPKICDIDTPKVSHKEQYAFETPKSYGAYPLLFDNLSIDGKVLYYFSFYINGDTLTHQRAIKLSIKYIPDAVFTKSMDGKKWRCLHCRGITENESICFDYDEELLKKIPRKLTQEQRQYLRKGSARLAAPLNPVVVEYINKHQSELNPWFVAEAKKRGVIK